MKVFCIIFAGIVILVVGIASLIDNSANEINFFGNDVLPVIFIGVIVAAILAKASR